MSKDKVISFLVGAGISGAITWYFTKKYYETIANSEIESVKEAYGRRLDEIEEAAGVKMPVDNPDEFTEKESKEPVHVITEKEKALMRMQSRSLPPLTEYHKMFTGKPSDALEEDPVEETEEWVEVEREEKSEEPEEVDPGKVGEVAFEHPEDDGEEYQKMDDDLLEEANADVRRAKDASDLPFIIGEVDYNNGRPDFEKLEWLYYTEDGTITDEDDEEIEDYADLIGDCLDHAGEDGAFAENNLDVLYVRNMAEGVDVAISKIYAAHRE